MMRAVNQKILEAVRKMRQNALPAKFKQSVELVVNVTGVDLSKPQNRFSEVVELPNDLGRKRRKILVVASGNLALEAGRTEGVFKGHREGGAGGIGGEKERCKKDR
jgi:large subunit ribosomal protein L1